MTQNDEQIPFHRNPRYYPVAFYLALMLTLFVLFPGAFGWILARPVPLGILAIVGFVGFGFWIAFRKKEPNESVFKLYAPSVALFVCLFLVIWIIRAFAYAQGSDILGALADHEVTVYNYVPREGPFVPEIHTTGSGTYVVDVPLNRIWTEIRLPLKNGQRVKIISTQPIRAALPAWYEAGKGGAVHRGVEVSVGERGARQRWPVQYTHDQWQDWQWIPYEDIWPPRSNYMDSCLLPYGTVFGCLLLNVGRDWVFRIEGQSEECQKTTDRFYFGIDFTFGDHIAAAGVYRVTFSIE